MSVKLNINTLTIDGQTKLLFTNNSGESKVVVSLDNNGFVGYSSTITLSSADEQFTTDNSKFTGTDAYSTTILKNRNYIVKANELYSPNSETGFYIENTLQTTTLGDKVKITNLTFGGNPVIMAARTFNASTLNISDSARWIVTNEPEYPGFSPNQEVFTGFDTSFISIVGHSNEFTLLYSPIGMCKNGVRLTVTLGTSPNQYTYTSTDYVWYRTKSTPNRMDRYLSTGTPPAPTPPDPGGGGNPDPFPGGPGTGGF